MVTNPTHPKEYQRTKGGFYVLKASLLQTPFIEVDGCPVTLPFRRADALLYYMLVHRSATRQELISLLWENRDESTGLKNLRNTLHALKKALGGEFLLSVQKSIIAVNPSWEVDCDYDRFVRDGDISACRGPFLKGFSIKNALSFDEWMLITRERLHTQYLGRLKEAGRQAAASGDIERAAEWATEYLRDEPFDESMVVFLMECYRRARQYVKAVEAYQGLKERLAEELAADPLESTSMLYHDIMKEWNETSGSVVAQERFAPLSHDALGNILLELASRSDRIPVHRLYGYDEPESDAGQSLKNGGTAGVACRRILESAYDSIERHHQSPPPAASKPGEFADEDALTTAGKYRNIADRYYKEGDRLHALKHWVMAMELESVSSYEPFALSGRGFSPPAPSQSIEDEAKQALQELSFLRRTGRDTTQLDRIEGMLTLVRGRAALYRGDIQLGRNLLGTLSAEEERNSYATVCACRLLASSAIYLQSAEVAERYIAAGTRLIERSDDPMLSAHFRRLRACCFCLRGAYDKSSYYLMEAVGDLEKLPPSVVMRAQLAATLYDYGRVCRHKLDYVGAVAHYKHALTLLENESLPGVVWLYVHYGRTAFALEDHTKAKELFKKGFEAAETSGELWGKGAAAAYYAYYLTLEGDYAGAASMLRRAQSCLQTIKSPLETGILCFVSMNMLHILNREQRTDTPLHRLLPHSPKVYAKHGILVLTGVPDVPEVELLVQGLHGAHSTWQYHRVYDRFASNLHYLAE